MEKRASEDKVSLHSDYFKRCKKCGAVENEFYYDREQPDQMETTTAMDGNYDWGMEFAGYEDTGMDFTDYENMDMDFTGYEDMGVAEGYMTSRDMDIPGMYPDQMVMGQMNMSQMEMPQMGMHQMDVNNMYYGMADMNDPYMNMNMNRENQMVPEMEYQQVDQMFQIMSQMLEEIINREARIMRLIEELKEYQR